MSPELERKLIAAGASSYLKSGTSLRMATTAAHTAMWARSNWILLVAGGAFLGMAIARRNR